MPIRIRPALLLALPVTAGLLPAQSREELTRQVFAAESSFARSMANRDLAAFAEHVASDGVFVGTGGPLRGREAVVEGWRRLFEGPNQPFSWASEAVEVLETGTLALSSGPVRDPTGRRTGTFNSIWRKGADGAWRVIFDKGCPVCDCAAKP